MRHYVHASRKHGHDYAWHVHVSAWMWFVLAHFIANHIHHAMAAEVNCCG